MDAPPAAPQVPQLEVLAAAHLSGSAQERRKRTSFFDDSESNILGARKEGWRAYWTPHCFTRAAWDEVVGADPDDFSAADAALGAAARVAGR